MVKRQRKEREEPKSCGGVKYSLLEREIRALLAAVLEDMDRKEAERRLKERSSKKKMSEKSIKQERQEMKGMKNMKQFMAEFAFRNKGELEKYIGYGLPHYRDESGELWFDVKKCNEWFLHGWFDSLPESEQMNVLKQTREKGK